MYKIIVFIPESHKEIVKTAMFQAGAGQMGNYSECSFEMKGTGQFRPGAGSTPHLGHLDQVEYVSEYRVEMVCLPKYLDGVIASMRSAHPYEEVAFDLLKLEN